ncbi:hypothetical protein X945_3358 [Burkholderia pseudomallei ABCPW 107]|nr:hypothetical protein X945_3358 [Burkholderia pseudomallei ABCPW 107]
MTGGEAARQRTDAPAKRDSTPWIRACPMPRKYVTM